MRPGGQLEGLLGPFPGAWGLPLGCRGRVSVPPGPWIPEFRFDSVSESPVRANTTEHPPPNHVVWHTCFTQAPPPAFPTGLCAGVPGSPGGREGQGRSVSQPWGHPEGEVGRQARGQRGGGLVHGGQAPCWGRLESRVLWTWLSSPPRTPWSPARQRILRMVLSAFGTWLTLANCTICAISGSGAPATMRLEGPGGGSLGLCVPSSFCG